jgi:hypothetical protein
MVQTPLEVSVCLNLKQVSHSAARAETVAIPGAYLSAGFVAACRVGRRRNTMPSMSMDNHRQ